MEAQANSSRATNARGDRTDAGRSEDGLQARTSAGTVDALIFANAEAHPDKIAVIDGTDSIDYARLIAHASTVADALAARGVPPGSLVGVCMHRGWALAATLLGVLRAGCAYVPLDPAYPVERVRDMLAHSRAAAVIVDDDATEALCEGVGACLRHDRLRVRDGHVVGAAGVSAAGISGAELAYVIYTSGSTGHPKGVAVEHRAVLAMIRAMRRLLDDEELDGVFAGASVCFDPSVMELFGTLALCGTVVLGRNALALPTHPAAGRIRTCILVPSSMQALLASHALPPGIRCVVFGGETLKRSLVDRLLALDSPPRVVNVYGPTEDTVFSTACEVRAGTGPITIGIAVPGSRTWILDAAMRPLPAGVAGELYLAGDKLARGYLHDDALTRERFIARTPDASLPEARLYRTGDLCRRNAAGEIEFLGRVDQQVKVRGYRIELGEIESTLERMPGVEAAAAAAVEGGAGQRLLVAYVSSRDRSATESAVKDFLAARLPPHMIPQRVMWLDDMPRLPNDKLDRARLPGLDAPHAVNDDHGTDTACAATADSERHAALLALINIELALLLHIADPAGIPPQASFDNLGLDSLSTLEFLGRLGKRLAREIDADVLAEHPTPSALAAHLLRIDITGTHRADTAKAPAHASLAALQAQLRSSHPTFQAAKASAWCATDKARFVREVMRMVNEQRRNPYGKVLRTGSGARGTVADAYNDESQDAIIWTTNLYLGLNRDREVIAQARDALERYGTGMGTSAAASGMTDLHLTFEREFAELVGKPAACLFPTGYTANVGAVAGLLGKHDVVVIDQLCHASIVDGARLCGATIRSFRHNDPADLDAVLASECSPYRTTLVVFEGVYSMGEGAAPVAELVRTAKRHGALVLVDEAHSFGFYGPRGAGICAAQGVTDQVDFIMTTLSKSLGSLGGVVAAREEHVDLLKSSARAYIFQASISPADTAAALASLRRIRSDDALRERLWDTARYMRQRFVDAGYDLGSGDGPIVTPHFGDKDKLYALVEALYRRGIQTSAVTYPIVEAGRGRLRLICSAAHTRDDVDRTLDALIDAEREVDRELAVAHDACVPPRDAGPRLQAWAGAFASRLRASLDIQSRAVPELGISATAPGLDAPVALVLRDGAIALGTDTSHDVSTCTLQFIDDDALAALQACDVQPLLRAVLNGRCLLSGQVEPFVWLIARLVEQREWSAAAA